MLCFAHLREIESVIRMAKRKIPTHVRAEIIARTAAGDTVREIAAATGVATQTVCTHQNSPEWQPLLVTLRNQHKARLQTLYDKSLRSVEDGLAATVPVIQGKDPKIPDHTVRLHASRVLTRILEAGDKAAIGQRMAEAATVQAGAAAAQAKCSIEELGLSIARSRGVELAGDVIDVAPEGEGE